MWFHSMQYKQMNEESRETWMEKPCEICGERRAFHNVQQALDCEEAIERLKGSSVKDKEE